MRWRINGFSDLVGNNQIDEPWLDEALTQFTTGLYFREMYGQQGLRGYLETCKAATNQ